MIKQFRFADDDTWRNGIEAMLDASPAVRPSRIAASAVIDWADGGSPAHSGVVDAGVNPLGAAPLGVVEAWFDDLAHLHRFESRSRGAAPGSVIVSAEAVVLRGAEWLAQRWQDDEPRFKHIALAVRAEGLTAVEFSERWRDHAGRARSSTGASTVIPDDVRGLAYVQNHPLRTGDGSPYGTGDGSPYGTGDGSPFGTGDGSPDDTDDGSPYDAVNEVYFDDLDGLVRRVEWFRDNAIGQVPDDLFGATSFMAVQEEVIARRRI